MKKLLKILAYTLGSIVAFIILLVLVIFLYFSIYGSRNAKKYGALAGPEIQAITIDGYTFRDLNKNGQLDIYEDTRQPQEARVDNLLSQMTLEEKAGLMFIPPVNMKKDGSVSEKPSLGDIFSFTSPGTSMMLYGKNINHFNIFNAAEKKNMAAWYNRLQKLAERTRLGIPVSIASDPRNHFSSNPLASVFSENFSLWPEPLGMAAIGDSLLVARFGDVARQEYMAVGLRIALHPMADLATEPRWGRISGTFGEDAVLSAKLTYAYVKGFQGDSLSNGSVACMTKHFSGGGPQKEGIDPHFPVAKGQIYPGNNFDYHLIPFEAALAAGTAEIMPYYGIPVGQGSENVGFSFNKDMITGLLRNKMGFDGVVCTDWGIITDTKVFGIMILPARAHGMRDASEEERMLKVVEAGVDQFGGELIPEMLVGLVNEGKISEARINTSVKRLLRVKFALGLFDDPFVDPEHAESVVGNADFMEEGMNAQRRSIVLLKNDDAGNGKILPLKEGTKIYIEGIDAETAARYGTVVKKPEQADVAVIRIKSPSQHIKGTGILGRLFSGGDLDFKGREKDKTLKLLKTVPTVVDIYLDRPAVIPDIAAAAKGLFANFGACDEALLDIVFGRYEPQGKLPVEMPSSMEAVRNQKEDLPYDSKDPLFPFGFGLHY